MNKISCILCKSVSFKFLFESSDIHGHAAIATSDKFNINRCLTCDCVFISGVVCDSSYFKKYYLDNYYGNINKEKIHDYFIIYL